MIIKYTHSLCSLCGYFRQWPRLCWISVTSEMIDDHGTFTHAWWWRHYLSIVILCGWLLHYLMSLIMMCWISATKSKMIIEHLLTRSSFLGIKSGWSRTGSCNMSEHLLTLEFGKTGYFDPPSCCVGNPWKGQKWWFAFTHPWDCPVLHS